VATIEASVAVKPPTGPEEDRHLNYIAIDRKIKDICQSC
jgi:hypothetical protein